ncbi:hypothetical protein GCM10025881_01210 [Pseudolysinimonas kribbensis]|uniref:Uncharacterized protein n=1 Tax=Pseudolysinimonas kribbensis TaxID=433641 RepID=A0ABQ6JYA2_9MICO|nr:hypothetical protein GCM10025881_01210 [Pseudolysinimonas kribbensis]
MPARAGAAAEVLVDVRLLQSGRSDVVGVSEPQEELSGFGDLLLGRVRDRLKLRSRMVGPATSSAQVVPGAEASDGGAGAVVG